MHCHDLEVEAFKVKLNCKTLKHATFLKTRLYPISKYSEMQKEIYLHKHMSELCWGENKSHFET